MLRLIKFPTLLRKDKVSVMNPITKSWLSGALIGLPVGALAIGTVSIGWLAAIGLGGAYLVNKVL
jgi:hypothetical protein